MKNSIYTTYTFRDKNNDQLIRELTIRGNTDPTDKIKLTLRELTEQYSLSESEIKIDN